VHGGKHECCCRKVLLSASRVAARAFASCSCACVSADADAVAASAVALPTSAALTACCSCVVSWVLLSNASFNFASAAVSPSCAS
jgi:hypothetical protein